MTDVRPQSNLAIIAAAGPGVGFAVARAFARIGYRIALIARRPDALDMLAAEIAADGGIARGFTADLSDLASIPAVMQRITDEMGAPAVLVWNAGRWVETPALSLSPEAFEEDLRLTTVGALVAAQAVTASMEAAGAGTILITGGGLALAPHFGTAVPALAAGKAAVRALVHASASEFAARGIHLGTVTIAGQVAPGTPFDPDRIAQAFLAMAAQERPGWTVETIFDGAA